MITYKYTGSQMSLTMCGVVFSKGKEVELSKDKEAELTQTSTFFNSLVDTGDVSKVDDAKVDDAKVKVKTKVESKKD